jgi:CBS domain-containing protein
MYMLYLSTILLVNLYSFISVGAFSLSRGDDVQRIFVGTPVHRLRRLVSDCMTPRKDLMTLTPSSSVDEAMRQLLLTGVSGAPVVDDETGTLLLGVISSFDFLQKEAGDGALLPISGSFENVEKYIDAAKKICAKRVEDVMSVDAVTIESSSTMRSAAALMAANNVHRLLVVDSGKLMGILTTSDVMKDMLHVVSILPFVAEEMKTKP